jgi:hypothetical protein
MAGAMNYGCTWILLGLSAFTKEFYKLLKTHPKADFPWMDAGSPLYYKV